MRLGMRDHVTVEGAIDRLAGAAQSVVADQIEVARLDVKVVGARILRSAALLIVGALMLFGSWTALTLAAYVLLAPQLSPEQRESDRRRQGLLLSRSHLSRQLEAAENPRHRQMLAAAIAELDRQLSSLE